jgi:hypothetical protein
MRNAPSFVWVSSRRGRQLRRPGATDACIVRGMPGLPGVSRLTSGGLGLSSGDSGCQLLRSPMARNDWNIQATSLCYLV